MKRFAYAAASTLTVAGWDFPHHICFSFFPSGLRSGGTRARAGALRRMKTPNGGAKNCQTQGGARSLECRSVRWRWLISPYQVWGARVTEFWPHREHLRQISAHASRATVAAKSLHPLTVSEVTGTPCRDKLLLFHLPPPPGPLCPPCSSCGRLRHTGCKGWGDANWCVGFGEQGGRRSSRMSCQSELALTQLTSHSQLSLSSPRGCEIKTRGHHMTFIVKTPLGITFPKRNSRLPLP